MSWKPSSEAKDIAIAALCNALSNDDLRRVVTQVEDHPEGGGPRSADFEEAASLLAFKLMIRA